MTEVNVLRPSKHTTTFMVKVPRFNKDRDEAVLEHAVIPATEFHELELAQGNDRLFPCPFARVMVATHA